VAHALHKTNVIDLSVLGDAADEIPSDPKVWKAHVVAYFY